MVARLAGPLKGVLAGIKKWTVVEGGYEVSELRIKLASWNVERRFVVLRERIREGKEAVWVASSWMCRAIPTGCG